MTTVLVLALLLGLLTAPLDGEAQSPGSSGAVTQLRIGYLSLYSGPSVLDEAFRQGLRELGYIEGTNITVEYRWAALKADRLPALAADLVRLNVALIVATGGPGVVRAARAESGAIPIVFTVGDAVGSGLVGSLARPGANLTGVNLLTIDLDTKRLALLKETVPRVTRVGIVSNPANPNRPRQLKEIRDAAATLGLQLAVVEVQTPAVLEQAFVTLTRDRPGALLVLADPLFLEQRDRIVDLAARHRLPAIYEWREFVEAGGLMSYGASVTQMYRRLATYVDRILKGAKPGDLPVEQPTEFELALNLKTAKALGLAIPQAVQVRANAVIQ